MTAQCLRKAVMAMLVILPATQSGAGEAHHVFRFWSNSGVAQRARTMCFSPDSSTLAVSVKDGVSLIECETGHVVDRYPLKPFSMAYSHDGSRILMISENGTHLVDARQLRRLPYRLAHEPGHVGISLKSQNGRLLVAGLQRGGPAERSGDIAPGDELIALAEGHGGREQRLIGRDVAKANALLDGVAGTHVKLRLIGNGLFDEKVVSLPRHRRLQSRSSTQFLPFNSQATGEVLVWCMLEGRHALVDAYTGKITTFIEAHRVRQVGQYAVSPDGKKFAILAKNRETRHAGIEIFNLVSLGKPGFIPFPDRSWKQIAFNENASRVLVLSDDTIEILDATNGEFLPPLFLGPETSPRSVNRSSHSLTGATARSTNDSIADGGEKYGKPVVMAVSGSQIVACGNDAGSVSIWDHSDYSRLATLNFGEAGIDLLTFSPDCHWLAVFENGTLHLLRHPASRESIEDTPR